MMRLLIVAFLVTSVLLPSVTYAHRPSTSFLRVDVRNDRIDLEWDVALRDLESLVGVDTSGDGAITWGELKSQQARLIDAIIPALRISAGQGPCSPTDPILRVNEHGDGAYANLAFSLTCSGSSLSFEYQLLFDTDPLHRALMTIRSSDNTVTKLFSNETRRHTFDAAGNRSVERLKEVYAFAAEGVWHIWIGYDHILFLIALLLPSVLSREGVSLREVLVDVAKVVTAFTVAHSLTLALAALEVVAIPSRIVEPVIAGSVGVAAICNLTGRLPIERSVIAFLFGLVHGFGFAGILRELGAETGNFIAGLFAFNVGVEVGQLAIVLSFVPLAFMLRHTTLYRTGVVKGGSAAIFVLALIWCFERSFDVTVWG